MADVAITKPKRRWRNPFKNPITQKELRSRMRGRRAFVTLSMYLLFMTMIITLVYYTYVQNVSYYSGGGSRDAGQVVFFTVVFVQIFLAGFIGPAFTAGAISGEKDRQTYDLLLTTLLSRSAIINGKLMSALSYVLLLIGASLPLHGIALLLGGVSPLQFAISQIVILFSAIAFAMWGLYASVRMKSSLSASVITYAGSLFFLGGLPFIALLTVGIAFFDFDPFGSTSQGVANFLAIGGMSLLAINTPATLIASQGIYFESNSIWAFQESVGYPVSYDVWILSPWWIHIIWMTLISLFLYWRCVSWLGRNVEKRKKK